VSSAAYDRRVTAKRLAAVVVAGLAAAQAGHLAVYELRFGAAAQQVQSAGAHAYFPAVARTSLGLGALAVLGAMVILGAARLATGRRIEPGSAPSFWRLLSVLYTIQLACFAAQETAEALFGGGRAVSAPLLLLWGAAGQLPVAFVAAFAARWLLARLGPALQALRPRLAALHEILIVTAAPPPCGAEIALSVPVLETSFTRGPPSF
jgi:hypothetical protein